MPEDSIRETGGDGWLILIAVAFAAWAYWGNPESTVAGWFWPEEPAPRENIDAFYNSDRGDLTNDISFAGVGLLEACRSWVYVQAGSRGDPNLMRGDDECGVGYLRDDGSLRIYRITVR